MTAASADAQAEAADAQALAGRLADKVTELEEELRALRAELAALTAEKGALQAKADGSPSRSRVSKTILRSEHLILVVNRDVNRFLLQHQSPLTKLFKHYDPDASGDEINISWDQTVQFATEFTVCPTLCDRAMLRELFDAVNNSDACV